MISNETTKRTFFGTIVLLLVFLVGLNGYLLYHYFLLHSSDPLDNFRGRFTTPVSLSTDKTLVGEGKYDRAITCRILMFDVHLVNIETGDEIILGPKQLAKAPPANMKPGKDLPIQFELFIPKTLYPGLWKPRWHAEYLCCRVGPHLPR